MAIVTLAITKAHLGIAHDDTSEDVALTQWVAHADAAVKAHLKQNVEQATYTEFYSGNGTNKLVLAQRPVQSITSIYEDAGGYFGEPAGAFASTTLLTAGTDYALNRDNANATEKSLSGIVYRIGGVWPGRSEHRGGLLVSGPAGGMGNIKCTFVAGYSTANLPADIKLATCQMVALMRQSAEYGQALSSFSLDYFSVTFAQSNPNDGSPMGSIKQLLSRYREVAW